MKHWVIVGAGSAGCVLASRLSADPGRHVTLLDDGPDLTPEAVPPAIAGPDFLAALQEPGRTHVDLLATRTSGTEPRPYQRGRGIGGSSAVNAMVALDGGSEQYAAWGWTDTAAAWQAVRIPAEQPDPAELGPIDRALLASHPDACIASLTRRNGRRVTAAEAYLWHVRHRPNLTVRPASEVQRIDIANRRATGVTLANGTHIDADHVVLCAGAIHTPALLLRSGIDTPGIGQGLQDHPSAPLTLQLASPSNTPTPTATDTGALVIGSLAQVEIDDNIIQLLPMNHLGSAQPGFGLLMAALMTPSGADGTVTIDANGLPVIDFNLLRNEDDLAGLAAGVRLALHTLEQPAFADIVDAIFIDDVGTSADALADDDALRAWLRRSGGDYVHASSSCAMGTVVDDHSAVIGYDDLSICDASIFPSIPDVNTHLPVTMAAERFCLRETMRP